MQRIMIVSDSHRRHGNLAEAIYNEQPFDLLIHLGDIEGEEDIMYQWSVSMSKHNYIYFSRFADSQGRVYSKRNRYSYVWTYSQTIDTDRR